MMKWIDQRYWEILRGQGLRSAAYLFIVIVVINIFFQPEGYQDIKHWILLSICFILYWFGITFIHRKGEADRKS